MFVGSNDGTTNACEADINRRVIIMAHVINDQCVSCGSCESECPVDAIKQGDPIYVIEADSCIDCGVCVASCPTDAIVAE